MADAGGDASALSDLQVAGGLAGLEGLEGLDGLQDGGASAGGAQADAAALTALLGGLGVVDAPAQAPVPTPHAPADDAADAADAPTEAGDKPGRVTNDTGGVDQEPTADDEEDADDTALLAAYQATVDDEYVDELLVATLIEHICSTPLKELTPYARGSKDDVRWAGLARVLVCGLLCGWRTHYALHAVVWRHLGVPPWLG